MAPLLEREELLTQLNGFRGDGGRLVFVGGEAGVGKTSLLRELAARARGRVLWGACENLTTPTPLGPLVDVAAEIGGDLSARVGAREEPRLVATALLAELRQPTLLLLEDLHWADQATLDVLRVLGRRAGTTASLVLASYREDEVDTAHPLRVVLGELASSPAVSRLAVPRLSLEAVRELSEPHGADGDAIHELTQGNAFYVTEILAAGSAELPETVRDAVLARTARLDREPRRLLEVVSAIPARAELSLLETVAPNELRELDACVASGVLRADGDGVAFRHELARLAVESAISPSRRRSLHLSIMRALVGRADPSRLAHHAEEAGEAEAVLRYATAAAREAAATSAHREAASQYERALRYADGLGTEERAALFDGYAEEAALTGRYVDSVSARLSALELYRELGEVRRTGETLSRLTNAYTRLGRNREAEEASRESIKVLESLPPGRELAWAYAVQAYARMLNRDNADGAAWGRKAAEAAAALGDRAVEAFGLNMLGTSLLMAGDLDRGARHLRESLEIAREEGHEVFVMSALSMLGTGFGEMFELEEAERYLCECIQFSEAHELSPTYAQSWRALVHVYRGRWDEGAELAGTLLRGAPDPISRISCQIALGRVRARRGDPGALDALDDALELARPGGHLQRLGHIHSARAEAAWLAGDSKRTVAEATSAYELALEKRHLWYAGELAYWQWTAGALAEAPDWIAEPYRLQLAGEPQAAAAAWRARGCPYESARALAESDDEEVVLEGLAELERLGAGPATKLLRQTLRTRGVAAPRGRRPSTRANPGELTSRELEVLRLVAAGRRNADVAAELVLSPRTVDHHVSAILRKLRVRTRGEAAAAAGELGLLQDR